MCHLADPDSKDGADKPKGDAPPSPAPPPDEAGQAADMGQDSSSTVSHHSCRPSYPGRPGPGWWWQRGPQQYSRGRALLGAVPAHPHLWRTRVANKSPGKHAVPSAKSCPGGLPPPQPAQPPACPRGLPLSAGQERLG